MSDTTAVNPQITDAISQSNVKVIGDAPAMAMGNLFVATSQALSNAAHNATNAQQQAYVTAQAATTQGVSLLYSVDTAATGVATARIENARVEAGPEHANLLEAQIRQSAAALEEVSAQFVARPQIEAALNHSIDGALDNAGRYAYALRVTADAFVAALEDMTQAYHRQLMSTVQIAATTACLQAMLQHPEKVEDYERVIRTIRALD